MQSLIAILIAIHNMGMPAPTISYQQTGNEIVTPVMIGCKTVLAFYADSETSPTIAICDNGSKLVVLN